MMLKLGDVILFQGDSITDAGRARTEPIDHGRGYVALIAALLQSRHPELDLTVLNRGISGNRTVDLLARWDADCVDLRPAVLSVMIGVNNVWRRYDSNDPTDPESFRGEYRTLLDRARSGGVREIIILEPFVLPVPDDRRGWREDLDPKIAVCRELASEFGARYVPLDGLFAAETSQTAPAYWAPDGVHPSPAGHGLIARAWLRTVGVSIDA